MILCPSSICNASSFIYDIIDNKYNIIITFMFIYTLKKFNLNIQVLMDGDSGYRDEQHSPIFDFNINSSKQE